MAHALCRIGKQQLGRPAADMSGVLFMVPFAEGSPLDIVPCLTASVKRLFDSGLLPTLYLLRIECLAFFCGPMRSSVARGFFWSAGTKVRALPPSLALALRCLGPKGIGFQDADHIPLREPLLGGMSPLCVLPAPETHMHHRCKDQAHASHGRPNNTIRWTGKRYTVAWPCSADGFHWIQGTFDTGARAAELIQAGQ